MFATPKNWIEVGSGFLKFGNVPIRRHEDANQNGVLDPGEDWDGDGRLDVKEPTLRLTFDTDGDGLKDATDVNEDGKADTMVSVQRGEKTVRWPDLDGDGTPDKSVAIDTDNDGNGDVIIPLDKDGDGKLDSFADVDGDGVRDGGNVANVLVALFRGQPFPVMDWSMVAFLCALVAISGNGGLGNSAISNYTREQGWGMGAHVGAIPSIVGGRDLKLSHVGMVFEPTIESLKQWRRWFWHVARDQWAVWMPGCFIGVALPAMMSLMFLPRGFYLEDQWQTAVFTANGLRDSVGGTWGSTFWMMTLFCAFLVLATGVTPAADGFLRRWVDVIWIASPRARRLDPRSIRYVYFGVLAIYSTFGVFMLTQESPTTLLFISAMISNFALGFSCLHTLAVNMTMLPRELRPGWFCRTALFLAGSFFLFVATIATYTTLKSRGII